jgi:hypothetical protein
MNFREGSTVWFGVWGWLESIIDDLDELKALYDPVTVGYCRVTVNRSPPAPTNQHEELGQ